jgi:uncharacterized repeat protein (TIGR03833 family)
MGGRFGKYGDLKRTDALRKSLKEKGRLQKDAIAGPDSRRKEVKDLPMSGKNRSDIKPGARVLVVQKQDQRTGKATEGIVQEILTKSSTHPHGIKVRLTSGIVGRVKSVLCK